MIFSKKFEELVHKQLHLHLSTCPQIKVMLFYDSPSFFECIAVYPHNTNSSFKPFKVEKASDTFETTINEFSLIYFNQGCDRKSTDYHQFEVNNNGFSIAFIHKVQICRTIVADIVEIVQILILQELSNQTVFHCQNIQSIIASINEAIIVTDPEGVINFINNRACQLTGWTEAEAMKTNIQEVFVMIQASDRLPIENPYLKVKNSRQGYTKQNHTLLISRYGFEFQMEHAATPLFINDRFNGCVVNFWDVTETYYERESLHRINTAVNHSHDGIFIANSNGQFLFANYSALSLLNVEEKSLHTKTVGDLWPEDQFRDYANDWDRILNKGVLEYELRIEVQKQTFYLHIRNFLINFKNEPLAVGFIRDITDVKKVSNSFEEGKKAFAHLLENLNIVPYRIDVESEKILYMGPQAKTILGYPSDEWETENDWHKRLHPDDAIMSNQHSIQRLSDGLAHSIEYRIIDKENNIKWIRDVINISKDSYGNPKEIIGFMVDITEAKEQENILSEIKKMHESILDSVQAAIFLIDADNIIISINQFGCNAISKSKEEIIGRMGREFLPNDYILEIQLARKRLLNEKKPQSFEFILELTNKTIEVYTTLAPIFDSHGKISKVCGSVIDISDTKKVEKELANVKNSLDFAFTAGNIAMWDYYLYTGKVITNSVFNQWVKNKPISSEGELSWLIKFVHPLDINTVYKAYYAHKKGAVDNFECEVRLRTGDDIYAWTYLVGKIVERNSSGDAQRIIGVHIDLSRQKTLLVELSKAKETAEKANQAKSLFLANLSHEIRTPMNSIIGFTQMLEKMVTNSKELNYVEAIKSSGKSLLNLINDILDLSKMEVNKLKVNYDPVDVRQVINETIQLFQLKIEQKNLTLRKVIDSNVPVALSLDELKFKQILINLIGNATKFTDRGGIGIIVSFIPNLANNGNLIVEVEDSGIGISEESQETIFQPFMQHEKHDSRKYEGTGLGLSITKKLTELMNGQISLKSEVGKGTTIKVMLKNLDITAAPSNHQSTPSISPKNDLHILLVSINPEMFESISKHLIYFNTKIGEVVGFYEATNYLKLVRPDIVMVQIWHDEHPPHLDQFVELAKNMNITIVGVANGDYSPDITKKEIPYFDGFINTPIQHDQLLEVINNLKEFVAEHKSNVLIEPIDIESAQRISTVAYSTLMPLLELLADIQPRDKVIELSKKLEELSNSLKHHQFNKYSHNLENAIEVFDVAGIARIIREVQEYLLQINHISNNEK